MNQGWSDKGDWRESRESSFVTVKYQWTMTVRTEECKKTWLKSRYPQARDPLHQPHGPSPGRDFTSDFPANIRVRRQTRDCYQGDAYIENIKKKLNRELGKRKEEKFHWISGVIKRSSSMSKEWSEQGTGSSCGKNDIYLFVRLEQSSDGTNNTGKAKATESETTGTVARAGRTCRRGRGTGGLDRAVMEGRVGLVPSLNVRTRIVTFHQTPRS